MITTMTVTIITITTAILVSKVLSLLFLVLFSSRQEQCEERLQELGDVQEIHQQKKQARCFRYH